MKDRTSLVIDASVARAAGGEGAQHPTSMHCRDFLKAVLRICNHLVLTSASRTEWKNHRSRFARQWHISMVAHRKVPAVDDGADTNLQDKILQTAPSDADRAAMAKDLHLLHAALQTDRIVVSLDETALALFAQASTTVGEIRDVIWINPAETTEGVIKWLEAGTPAEEPRKLRARAR